jgi:hypothetical protein
MGAHEPDFVLMRPGTADVIALVEITEATIEADQREMTTFALSDKRMALPGHSGGRFPRGAGAPGLAWASDIIDAIKRKETKVIFKSSLTTPSLDYLSHFERLAIARRSTGSRRQKRVQSDWSPARGNRQ